MISSGSFPPFSERLKPPAFQSLLRPLMAKLAGRCVTADRVITAALVGLIGRALGLLSDLPD